jgi:hypothetical protein
MIRTPIIGIEKDELDEMLKKLIGLLSDFEKIVLYVYIAENYTYEQMAKIVSEKTKIKCNVRIIANALYRIKRKGIRLKKEADDKE